MFKIFYSRNNQKTLWFHAFRHIPFFTNHLSVRFTCIIFMIFICQNFLIVPFHSISVVIVFKTVNLLMLSCFSLTTSVYVLLVLFSWFYMLKIFNRSISFHLDCYCYDIFYYLIYNVIYFYLFYYNINKIRISLKFF